MSEANVNDFRWFSKPVKRGSAEKQEKEVVFNNFFVFPYIDKPYYAMLIAYQGSSRMTTPYQFILCSSLIIMEKRIICNKCFPQRNQEE